ncbi:MAG: hypothetical protein ACLUJG_09255 [Lawsonibacter sp.]
MAETRFLTSCAERLPLGSRSALLLEGLALGYIKTRRSTGVRYRSQAASRESSRVAGS